MYNFTYLVVLFQKESPILLAAFSLFLLIFSVNTFLSFFKTILSRAQSKVFFVLKEIVLQIPSLNIKSKYWFLDQYRVPFQGISLPDLQQEHTIFRRKVLFA
jgi:hypothetical protein